MKNLEIKMVFNETNVSDMDPTRPGGKQGGKGDKEVWDIYYGNIEKWGKVVVIILLK